ncbi:MAG: hypothetical protein R3311_03020, partial [Oceanisphaera sp.]|nr:hypothetical protein [Oceanisphaera sp.]
GKTGAGIMTHEGDDFLTKEPGIIPKLAHRPNLDRVKADPAVVRCDQKSLKVIIIHVHSTPA